MFLFLYFSNSVCASSKYLIDVPFIAIIISFVFKSAFVFGESSEIPATTKGYLGYKKGPASLPLSIN